MYNLGVCPISRSIAQGTRWNIRHQGKDRGNECQHSNGVGATGREERRTGGKSTEIIKCRIIFRGSTIMLVHTGYNQQNFNSNCEQKVFQRLESIHAANKMIQELQNQHLKLIRGYSFAKLIGRFN